MEELKVTKERVLEAAHSCGDAKAVLEKLFPDAFDRVYQTGDVFKVTGMGDYVIAQIGFGLCSLLSTYDYNRLKEGIKVENIPRITEEEVLKMSGERHFICIARRGDTK